MWLATIKAAPCSKKTNLACNSTKPPVLVEKVSVCPSNCSTGRQRGGSVFHPHHLAPSNAYQRLPCSSLPPAGSGASLGSTIRCSSWRRSDLTVVAHKEKILRMSVSLPPAANMCLPSETKKPALSDSPVWVWDVSRCILWSYEMTVRPCSFNGCKQLTRGCARAADGSRIKYVELLL